MSEMGPPDGSSPATSGETRSGKCGHGASWRQGLGQSSPDAATPTGDTNKGPPAKSSQQPATNHGRRAPDTNFSPISVSIPTDSLLEEDFLTSASFSKRGSLMFGGKRAFPAEMMASESSQLAVDATEKPPRSFPLVTTKKQADDRKDSVEPPSTAAADSAPANDATEVAPAKPRSTPSVRVLSADIERDSQKVRSLYEVGDAINWEQGAPAPASAGERLSPTPEDPVDKDKHDTYDFLGS